MFLDSVKDEVITKINEATQQHKGIKWYICLRIKLIRKVSATEEETCSPFFRSNCQTTLQNEIPNMEMAIKKVLTSFEEFQGRGSGWVIESIQYMELMTAAY
ncbi:penicillin-binding protein 1b, partial [Lasius niger]